MDEVMMAGDIVHIDMGAEILRQVDDKTVEVKWHNGGLISLVPIYAMRKISPGPARRDVAMTGNAFLG